MTDVFVTSHTPSLGSGRALRTYAVIRALAMLGGVDVVYSVFGHAEPAPELVNTDGVSLVPILPSRGVARGLTYAAALVRGVPRGFARGISPELVAAVKRLAPGHRRIIADGPVVAAALLSLAREHYLVYNSHNIESSLRSSIPGEAKRFGSAERLTRFEKRLFTTAAETWVVSEVDMQDALRLVPNGTFRYVPNAVDVKSIVAASRSGSHRLLFSGDFSYAPNRIALGFLVDQVMPRVWAKDEKAVLVVTGRALAVPSGADDRIEWMGFVDDLESVYARVDCVVVPLAQSGGSPLKFVEALAHGVPVVATSTAARGLNAAAGVHFIEADSPVVFADAVVRVLRDGEPGIAEAGRALVEREYSLEQLSRLVA